MAFPFGSGYSEDERVCGAHSSGGLPFPDQETFAYVKMSIKDPFCGLSHAFGALLAVVGLVTLILLANGDPLRVTSFAVYGVTLILLYVASALYHSLKVNEKLTSALYGLDRAAIYALIAGTYTPVCLVGLGGGWGWSLFGVVWGLAFTGILIDVISRRRTPNWLQALLYLITGWLAVIAIRPLLHALSIPALIWLAAGCIIYTGGAIICVLDRPRLKPGHFGAHDLWHALVLAGSACHFAVMLHLAHATP